jgi:chromosome segregation ATPase
MVVGMSSGADTVNRWIELHNTFDRTFLTMKNQRDVLERENVHLRKKMNDLTTAYEACKEECAKEKEKMGEMLELTRNFKAEVRDALESGHIELQDMINHLEEECAKEKEKMGKVLELTLKFQKEFEGFNSGPAKNVSELRGFLTKIITSYLSVLKQTYYIRY